MQKRIQLMCQFHKGRYSLHKTNLVQVVSTHSNRTQSFTFYLKAEKYFGVKAAAALLTWQLSHSQKIPFGQKMCSINSPITSLESGRYWRIMNFNDLFKQSI